MRIKLRGENILMIFPLNTMYSCHQYQSLHNEDCVSPEHISDIPGNGITEENTSKNSFNVKDFLCLKWICLSLRAE